MNIFVLGCNGMIGHLVALYFKEKGYNVGGYDCTKGAFVPHTMGNLHDEARIRKAFEDSQPDAVINCTAIVNQEAEDNKAEAAYQNVYLPHLLEKWTERTSTVVVHRSTDCIFSGEKGQYTLNDTPDAKSFYARTKAVGELDNDKDITIRVSLIGPALTKEDGSLMNWYLQQNGNVRGYANAIWTGLTTLEYAKTIDRLLQQKAHGVFQAAPKSSISKYELLRLFEKHFPKNRNIEKIENKRVDKSLIPHWGEYDINVTEYEEQIVEMKEWINKHNWIYPKYYVK